MEWRADEICTFKSHQSISQNIIILLLFLNENLFLQKSFFCILTILCRDMVHGLISEMIMLFQRAVFSGARFGVYTERSQLTFFEKCYLLIFYLQFFNGNRNRYNMSKKNEKGLQQFWFRCLQGRTECADAADRPTRATRLWSWRRNSTRTTILPGGGGSRWHTHSAWRKGKSRFGSRIGEWSWRRRFRRLRS